MMRKKERLSRQEFNRFFSAGKRFHSPHFQLVYTPHPQTHASVVISKKVESLAVKRNKLRRRVYDCIRATLDTHTKQGVFIILAKTGSASIPFIAIKEEIGKMVGGALKVY